MRPHRFTRRIRLGTCDPRDAGACRTREQAAELTERLRRELDARQERRCRARGAGRDREARRRRDESRELEQPLTEQGTRIPRFFLRVSRERQRERLRVRLDDLAKRSKLGPQDLGERGSWMAYPSDFEKALAAIRIDAAPWYVVPAGHAWYRGLVVAGHLVRAREERDPRPPTPDGRDWKTLCRRLGEA